MNIFKKKRLLLYKRINDAEMSDGSVPFAVMKSDILNLKQSEKGAGRCWHVKTAENTKYM